MIDGLRTADEGRIVVMYRHMSEKRYCTRILSYYGSNDRSHYWKELNDINELAT